MATYVNLDTIQRPVATNISSVPWFDQVNDNFTALTGSYPAVAHRANALSLAAGSVPIQHDSIIFDPYNCLVNLSSTTAGYKCPVAGYYYVASMAHVVATGAGFRFLSMIYVNGALARRGTDYNAPTGNPGGPAFATLHCNAGDIISGWAYVSTATTLNVAGQYNVISFCLLSTT